jgi:hypothetical protein
VFDVTNRVHREHRDVVRKMRDLVRFLRKYTLIFSLFSLCSLWSKVSGNYCRKAQFKERMSRSIQQAKEGKVRTVSSEELDQWEEELENDPGNDPFK